MIDDGAVQASPEAAAEQNAAQETIGQETIGHETIGDEVHATETASADTLPAANAEETIASSSEPPAEDIVASPETSLDSGTGTDTLPSQAAIEEPARPDTRSSDTSFQEASASGMRGDPCPHRPSGAALPAPSSAQACSAASSARGSSMDCRPGRRRLPRTIRESPSWSSA